VCAIDVTRAEQRGSGAALEPQRPVMAERAA